VTWRLCGSQRKNNALYCIETSLPAVDRLVYIEETWQVINDKNPLQKTFVGKHAILLACSIPSLIACASPLAFNDRAIDCLVKIYLEANTDQLNPFLILMGGKSFKIPLRQAIAKHLFSIGFAVHHVHWHGLSTTADSTFVTHIAEIWTKSCKQ